MWESRGQQKKLQNIESFLSISSEHNKPTGRVDKEKNRKKESFIFLKMLRSSRDVGSSENREGEMSDGPNLTSKIGFTDMPEFGGEGNLPPTPPDSDIPVE